MNVCIKEKEDLIPFYGAEYWYTERSCLFFIEFIGSDEMEGIILYRNKSKRHDKITASLLKQINKRIEKGKTKVMDFFGCARAGSFYFSGNCDYNNRILFRTT